MTGQAVVPTPRSLGELPAGARPLIATLLRSCRFGAQPLSVRSFNAMSEAYIWDQFRATGLTVGSDDARGERVGEGAIVPDSLDLCPLERGGV